MESEEHWGDWEKPEEPSGQFFLGQRGEKAVSFSTLSVSQCQDRPRGLLLYISAWDFPTTCSDQQLMLNSTEKPAVNSEQPIEQNPWNIDGHFLRTRFRSSVLCAGWRFSSRQRRCYWFFILHSLLTVLPFSLLLGTFSLPQPHVWKKEKKRFAEGNRKYTTGLYCFVINTARQPFNSNNRSASGGSPPPAWTSFSLERNSFLPVIHVASAAFCFSPLQPERQDVIEGYQWPLWHFVRVGAVFFIAFFTEQLSLCLLAAVSFFLFKSTTCQECPLNVWLFQLASSYEEV